MENLFMMTIRMMFWIIFRMTIRLTLTLLRLHSGKACCLKDGKTEEIEAIPSSPCVTYF